MRRLKLYYMAIKVVNCKLKTEKCMEKARRAGAKCRMRRYNYWLKRSINYDLQISELEAAMI